MKQRHLRTLDLKGFPSSKIVFSPDGQWIAAGGGAGKQFARLAVWRAGANELVSMSETGKASLRSLRFSMNGKVLAAGYSSSSDAQLWCVPSLTLLSNVPLRLSRPISKAEQERHDKDKRIIQDAVAGKDQKAMIEAILKHGRVDLRDTVVEELAFSSDGTMLAAACWDLTVKLWSLKGEPHLRELEPRHRDNVDYVAFLGGGSLVSGTADEVRVWDVATGGLVRRMPIRSKDGVWKHVLSVDNMLLASVSIGGTVRVWDTRNWKHDSNALGFAPKLITSIECSPDSETIAIAYDRSVAFWSVSKAAVVDVWTLGGSVASVAFAPDGRSLGIVERDANKPARIAIYALDSAKA